jgi:hypothetical protein
MLSLSGPSSLPKTGIRELNPQQIAGYLLAALIIPSRDDPDDKRAHKVHCVATREATEEALLQAPLATTLQAPQMNHEPSKRWCRSLTF